MIADEIIRYFVVQIKSTMKIFYATFKQCSKYAMILKTTQYEVYHSKIT